MKKRIFSILIVVCMAFNMLPASIIATSNEDISTNSFDSDVPCENHQEHTFGEDGCGYIETVIAHECNHVHNDDCEFVAAAKAQEKTEEIPCDKECKGEHSANCAYSPAKEAITGTVGHTCRHTHDVKCGFAEAVAGSPCTHKCELNNAAVMTQLDPKQLTNWDSVATGNFEEKATSLKSYTFYDDNRSPVLLTVETDKKLGSMENPISIANEADLIRFGKQDSDDTSDKYYVLDKEDGVYDMDGSKKYMLPLFKEVVSTDSDMPSKYNAFQGILAGNGATITNASIGDYSGFNGAYSPGLFSGIENRGIYDLTLKDSSFYIGNLVSTTLEYVGGIVARAKNAEIVNCHTSNNNYSGLSHLNRNFMGGIVGYTDGNILNCSNTSDISGKGNYLSLGGIAGYANNIMNSYNTGDISGEGDNLSLGGIAGYSDNIMNSYNTGDISGKGDNLSLGGIAGNASNVINCYWLVGSAGTITGDESEVTGSGSFTDKGGVLTAGTAKNCIEDQELEEYADTLLNALNGFAQLLNTANNTNAVRLWEIVSDRNAGYPVFYSPHKHCICGGDKNIGDHTNHDNVTYTAVNNTYKLPGNNVSNSGYTITEGRYVLTEDVTITETQIVAENTVVTICLNGHNLTADGGNYELLSVNGTLNICDCQGSGQITGIHRILVSGVIDSAISVNNIAAAFNLYGGSITGNTGCAVDNGGKFTMYDGSIAANADDDNGGVNNLDTFTMYGGSITGNTTTGNDSLSGGVLNQSTMTISGNANISGNMKNGTNSDVVLIYKAGTPIPTIGIGGALTTQSPIGVKILEMDSKGELTSVGGVFTSGSAVSNSNYANKFKSDNSTFAVAVDGSQLKLVEGISVTNISLNKNSMSLYSNSSPKSETLTATITPANASNKNIRWNSSDSSVATVINGVVTAVGNGTTTITASTLDGNMNATCIVTVSSYNSSGSSNSGSGSSYIRPTKPVTGSTDNKAIVDDKGNATVNVTSKNITEALANAKSVANKNGVKAGEVTAVIHVSTGGMDANTVTVNLPKTVQNNIINNKISKVELVIDRPDITIGINLSAITEMYKQAKKDVQLSAKKTDSSKLLTEGKNVIGNRPVYDFKATYGGKSIINFGTGLISVEIPYKLQNGESAGGLYAISLDENGKATYLRNSSYDTYRETLVFSTNHFSVYGIGYNEPMKFTDISNHWAKSDIEFAVNRGLMTGSSTSTFAPDSIMTREMFAMVLGKLAEADVSSYKTSSFKDVKADSHFLGYIEWANKNKIMVGVGNGKFAPDAPMTRVEIATTMDKYASVIGYKLPEVHVTNNFADKSKISSSSLPAVKRVQMAGIITTKNNNLFDPRGTSTKAEVSAMLKRFVELTIFSETAQGWMMNDSGAWMYYENGIAITGTKNIDGTSYTFNKYGEMFVTPKN